MRPFSFIGLLWLAWIGVWVIASFWTNPPEARAPRRDNIPFRIVTLAGAVLLGWSAQGATGLNGIAGWSCVAIVAAGVGFALWARWHLGRFWSANVMRKEGHRIVETGPYAIVRHPIYTGVIAALAGTAVAEVRWFAVVGAALFAVGFAMKARLEENFLRQEFGAAYDAYARRVPMLIPFPPRTG